MYYGEKLNSVSHLVGAVLALVGLGALLTVSIQNQDPMQIISFSIFGGTMVLMYTMSTLYHSFHPPGLKNLFKIFDHVAIYILIAGSYTPFILTDLGNETGLQILGLVWFLACLGILSEVFLHGRNVKIGQVVIYLAMGWACSLDIDGLAGSLPEPGFFWLVTGGIAYTAGVVFYVADKMKLFPHAHGVWHMFVLAGSMSHFIAVIGYVR